MLTVSEFAAREIEEILGVSARSAPRRRRGRGAPPSGRAPPRRRLAAARRAGVPAARRGSPTSVGSRRTSTSTHRPRARQSWFARRWSSGEPASRISCSWARRAPTTFTEWEPVSDEAIAECGTRAVRAVDGLHARMRSFVICLTGTQRVAPALRERGFGLPAVEARRVWRASRRDHASPLPQLLEVAATSSRRETSRARAAMRALLDDDERERRGRVALERASRLTWRASARATLVGAARRRRALAPRAAPVPAVRMTSLRFCMVTTFYPPRSFGGDAVAVQSLARALVRVAITSQCLRRRCVSHAVGQAGCRAAARATMASSCIGSRAGSAPSPSR